MCFFLPVNAFARKKRFRGVRANRTNGRSRNEAGVMAKHHTSKRDYLMHNSLSKHPLRGRSNEGTGPTPMNGLIPNTLALIGAVCACKNFTSRVTAKDRRLLRRRSTLPSFPTTSDAFRRPGRSESAADDKKQTDNSSTQQRRSGYDLDREMGFHKCGLNKSERIAYPFRDLLLHSIPPRGSSSIAMKGDVSSPLVSK
jgi:hypothetical protein